MNGVIRSIISVSIAGLEVTLSLSPGVVAGDFITLGYTAPSSFPSSNRPVQDVASNDAISFTSQTVRNITTSIYLPSQEIP